MAEGGLADPNLAALAISQAEGDLIEAAFILRAYRSTLPRVGYSAHVDSRDMLVLRRVSSIFRDIPGGQYLGMTRDYAIRLLELSIPGSEAEAPGVTQDERNGTGHAGPAKFPTVVDFLREEGMLAARPRAVSSEAPFDITRTPVKFPLPRSGRLQSLARGESGGLLAFAYSSMRGWGGAGHGALAELRQGEIPIRVHHPLTGRPATLGRLPVTEAQFVSGGRASRQDPDVTEYELGYGLVPGKDERKAISMAIIDATLRDVPTDRKRPIEDEEFVISHVDGVESTGFVEHLKLPHYVTFQAGLARARRFNTLLEEATHA